MTQSRSATRRALQDLRGLRVVHRHGPGDRVQRVHGVRPQREPRRRGPGVPAGHALVLQRGERRLLGRRPQEPRRAEPQGVGGGVLPRDEAHRAARLLQRAALVRALLGGAPGRPARPLKPARVVRVGQALSRSPGRARRRPRRSRRRRSRWPSRSRACSRPCPSRSSRRPSTSTRPSSTRATSINGRRAGTRRRARRPGRRAGARGGRVRS